MVTVGRNRLSSIVLKDTVSLLVRGFDVLSLPLTVPRDQPGSGQGFWRTLGINIFESEGVWETWILDQLLSDSKTIQQFITIMDITLAKDRRKSMGSLTPPNLPH